MKVVLDALVEVSLVECSEPEIRPSVGAEPAVGQFDGSFAQASHFGEVACAEQRVLCGDSLNTYVLGKVVAKVREHQALTTAATDPSKRRRG